MSKICEYCGQNARNVGVYLTNEKILCSKCASLIRENIDALYVANTEEKFIELKDKLISKSKMNFGDEITRYIETIANKIYSRMSYAQSAPGDKKKGYSPDYASENSSGMFDNIGGKIKILAQIFTWIGIIASVIGGINIISIDPDDMGLLGVIVMIVGAILSWISSFILYGFGQLVDNSDKIVSVMKKE